MREPEKRPNLTLGIGLHTIGETDYHADPCEKPSLSASVAKVLLNESPLHAWTIHPQLNPSWKPAMYDSTKQRQLDYGSAFHLLTLEPTRHADVLPILADSYRTKEAQGLREAAYASGRIPLLERDFVAVTNMVAATRRQLRDSELDTAFDAGDAEVAAIWQDGPSYCRARLDWLTADRKLIVDLKSTDTSANPEAFQRQILNLGHDLQSSFYRRGVHMLTGVLPKFVYVIVEMSAPYAMSLVGLSPSWQDLADRKMHLALKVWSECMKSGKWPGYPSRVAWVDCPAWAEAVQMERELREAAE